MKIPKDGYGAHKAFARRFARAIEHGGMSGMTYAELGEIFSLSAPVVQRLAHGKQFTTGETIGRIAMATHTNPIWLYTGSGTVLIETGRTIVQILKGQGYSARQISAFNGLLKAMKPDGI